MKVLLIKPHSQCDHIQPSIGLGYLATAVRDKHEVEIVDCVKDDLPAPRLLDRIRAARPDVVGFQHFSLDTTFIRACLRALREESPEVVTMVGGPHPSALPKETMEYFGGALDYAFAGEAEIGFPKLLAAVDEGDRGNEARVGAIPGLVWRDRAGEARANPTQFTEDVDSLGMPSWDLLRPDTYPESQHGAFFAKFPIATLITHRGCPYECTYCSAFINSGYKLRGRSADHVMNEILHLYHRYGIREFHFIDDNFTLNRSFVMELCEKIVEARLDIAWAVPNGVRIDTLDPEMLALMRRSGLYLISLGIESGSDPVLESIKKDSSVEMIRRVTRMVARAGIAMAGFFVLGFPGETEADIRRTIDFSLRLGLVRANFFTFFPFPGTEDYERLRKSGRLAGPIWDAPPFSQCVQSFCEVPTERLIALRRLAFARFYLRPGVLAYNLSQIRNLRHLRYLARRGARWLL